MKKRSTLESEIASESNNYLKKNYQLVPMHSVNKGVCSCGDENCSKQGKHPRTAWKNDHKVTAATIRNWIDQWGTFNLALKTGSGVVVIDVDRKHGGLETLSKFEQEHGPMPVTPTVTTGGGGKHYYFSYDPALKIKSAVSIAPGFDVRAEGAIAIAPPSIHSSGKPYLWDEGKALLDVPLAPLPEALFNLIVEPKQDTKTASPNAEKMRVFKAGERNNEMFKLARNLLNKGISQESLPDHLGLINNTQFEPPLDVDEMVQIISSACSYQNSPANSHPYFVENGHTFMKSGEKIEQIGNFHISLEEQLKIYDGSDSRPTTNFLLKVHYPKLSMSHFLVKPEEFEDSSYLIHLDAQLMLNNERMRGHLSKAIRHLGNLNSTQHINIHTGWIKLNEKQVFLSNSGAIGENGLIPNYRTHEDYGGPNGYALSLAADERHLKYLMHQLLEMLTVADPRVTYLLLAAAFRAPLCSIAPVDYSVGLIGKTGSKKTTLAALFLCLFGPDFSVSKTPENFSSTPNAIQRHTFLHKDVLTVLDDYVVGEVAEVNAERVLRSIGNRAPKNRLDKDANIRTSYVPRGVLVFTGEDMNLNQSIRSRTILTFLDPKLTNDQLLTKFQLVAKSGKLATIMGEYIRWLAMNYEKVASEMKNTSIASRANGDFKGLHARTASNLTDLFMGIQYFLRFAEEKNTLEGDQISYVRNQAYLTFQELVKVQDEQNIGSDPVEVFLLCLRGCLETQQAHIIPTDHKQISKFCKLLGHRLVPQGFGDDLYTPMGEKIGTIKNNQLYLIVDKALLAVKYYARTRNVKFNLTQNMLGRHLKEANLIVTDKQRTTIKRAVQGERERFWVFDNWLELLAPEYEMEIQTVDLDPRKLGAINSKAPFAPLFKGGAVVERKNEDPVVTLGNENATKCNDEDLH